MTSAKTILKKCLPAFLLCLLLLVGCTSAPISIDESGESEASKAESEQINESATSGGESDQADESTTSGGESEPEQSDMPEDYTNRVNEGWTAPEQSDLLGTAWGFEEYTEDCFLISNLISFNEETADVIWHDGIDEEAHTYGNAFYEITLENGKAIMEIDFAEMAGKLYYYLLMSPDGDAIYTLELISDENSDSQPASAVLDKKKTANPMELVGKWDRMKTMVEGCEEETEPNTCIVEITGDSKDNLKISYTEKRDFSNVTYSDKYLIFSLGALPVYNDCGNDVWYADVDHVGEYNTTYAITLLEDGTLLLQNYFTVDGAPMVSYEWFKRVS